MLSTRLADSSLKEYTDVETGYNSKAKKNESTYKWHALWKSWIKRLLLEMSILELNQLVKIAEDRFGRLM